MAAGLVGLGAGGTALGGLVRAGSGLGVGKTLPDGTVRLSSNENPLGISPAAREAVVASLVDANRYPFSFSGPLYDALTTHLGVKRENVILGAGSTEILRMAVHAWQAPDAPLVVAEPTFEDVLDYQDPLPYELIKIPLTADHAHDLGRMREIVEEQRRPSVVYVCNPNNPTGTITPSAELDDWIRDAPETVMFLVDEAYYEYADHPDYWSAISWIEEKPNVIVARTFSKIYAMAGLRLGYAVAHPSSIRRLGQFVCQNNPNIPAGAAATASLTDAGLIDRSVAVNAESKEIVHTTLDELGLEYLPTQANFIMHRVHGDLGTYRDRMRERGLLVGRDFPPMLEWNRLSFGLPDEMDRWASALKDLRRMGQI
jgi:histidinol-phosphate aminotransferase